MLNISTLGEGLEFRQIKETLFRRFTLALAVFGYGIVQVINFCFNPNYLFPQLHASEAWLYIGAIKMFSHNIYDFTIVFLYGINI